MQSINEGLFNKTAEYAVDKSFYDMCQKILDNVYKNFGDLPQYGWVNKNKFLKDHKTFSKSIEKNKNKIIDAKKNNIPKVKLRVNIRYAGVNSNKAFKILRNTLSNFGFKLSKKFDNAFKNVFKGQTLYRKENDGTYTILNYSVSYITYNYAEAGLDKAIINIANLPDNDKTKKRLNLENAIEISENYIVDLNILKEAFKDTIYDEDLGIFSMNESNIKFM